MRMMYETKLGDTVVVDENGIDQYGQYRIAYEGRLYIREVGGSYDEILETREEIVVCKKSS